MDDTNLKFLISLIRFSISLQITIVTVPYVLFNLATINNSAYCTAIASPGIKEDRISALVNRLVK